MAWEEPVKEAEQRLETDFADTYKRYIDEATAQLSRDPAYRDAIIKQLSVWTPFLPHGLACSISSVFV